MRLWDWIIVALCVIGTAALLCGCDADTDTPVGYEGDPELVEMAKQLRPQEPPLLMRLEWGDESLCWPDLITIDRSVRGTPHARTHLRQELDELWTHWLRADDPEALARIDANDRANAGMLIDPMTPEEAAAARAKVDAAIQEAGR